MTQSVVRLALPTDANTLSELGWSTFFQTATQQFSMPYHPDDMTDFRKQEYAPAVYNGFISDPSSSVWIAELNGTPVGYAYAGTASLPHPNVQPADGELKRLYVTRPAQGLGSADA